ncbi:hypothetical protein ACFQS3_07150 [Glycomyces mayteni]|uniref:Uncharacterized protein n=1 Tax=Glycomyces mayteni TaxID=543887 RepID=A0ABW2D3T6_9ACTN
MTESRSSALAGARASMTVIRPPPDSSASKSIRGSIGCPGSSPHSSVNTPYPGSNAHTRATSRPSGERHTYAQSPTPHTFQPSASSTPAAAR